MKNHIFIFLPLILIICACSHFNGNIQKDDSVPDIEPDYAGVTIPPNIAPLNFIIRETGEKFEMTAVSGKSNETIIVRSRSGKIKFPLRKWKKLVESSTGGEINIKIKTSEKGMTKEYAPFSISVAEERVDPWLAYRLIPPGYYSWSHIRIMQRCLENFRTKIVVENNLLDKNCVNCHSFAQNNPDRFMVHVRGSKSGTYFMDNGKLKRTDPKTETMPGNATYPCWHPGGRFIAYSSNQVRQSFYAGAEKSIEVFDIAASMVVFDTKENKILNVNEEDTARYLRTFPGWSADGKYLYYCRAVNLIGSKPAMDQILTIHHDLVRKSFDELTGTFGKTEMVFDASALNKSVSFPRVSPDGKYLIFTLHDFGTFPIWHKEADLYSLELQSGVVSRLGLNSDQAESYHSWSGNGRWLVFSSKRSDGRSTRPYIAYIGTDGKSSKPFMLPQEDPSVYNTMIESFNIPEFVSGEIKAGPRDFEAASQQEPVKLSASGVVENHTANAASASGINAHE